MRQAEIEEVKKLTGRICDLTMAKDKNPKAEVNRVIDDQIRGVRSRALLLKGSPHELQMRSFITHEGSERDED
jgi:hypothetical protein